MKKTTSSLPLICVADFGASLVDRGWPRTRGLLIYQPVARCYGSTPPNAIVQKRGLSIWVAVPVEVEETVPGAVVELQRPKRSAEQIAALPPFGSAVREAHVRANGASYEPETLVYLLRESIDRADTALFNHLGHLLIGQIDGRECTGGQCERIIMSVAMSLGATSRR